MLALCGKEKDNDKDGIASIVMTEQEITKTTIASIIV
jgi:hypothetical protein